MLIIWKKPLKNGSEIIQSEIEERVKISKMMKETSRTVEICAGSYQDCLAAEKGGATRVELNSALSVGGLTPSVVMLRRVKKETALRVICMVRPRAAGFCYDEKDTAVMMEEARLLLENGADGIAFGFLDEAGAVKEKDTKQMIDLIHSFGKEAVFHRAFDVTADPYQAMETLIVCGADRVLTSGMQSKAIEGTLLIKELQQRYGSQIEILAGSGVNAENAETLIKETGISQVHSSCKSFLLDPTTARGNVSYAYLSKEHESDYDVVDAEKVRALVKAVCH